MSAITNYIPFFCVINFGFKAVSNLCTYISIMFVVLIRTYALMFLFSLLSNYLFQWLTAIHYEFALALNPCTMIYTHMYIHTMDIVPYKAN